MSNKKSYPKIFPDATAAIFDITKASALIPGGFDLCGIPENTILGKAVEAFIDTAKALTIL